MKKEPYELRKHPEYGYLHVSPTPGVEEITRYYAEEFYSGEYKRFNNSALKVQLEDREFLDGHREDVLHAIAEVLGEPLEGKSVLDVGCGWAQNLLYFQQRGMKCSGFDPAPEAVAYAKGQGLRVEVAGMDRMAVFPGERFDVVTLFHVLEHLGDPEAVLVEIRKSVLHPDGVLVIEVPNDFNPLQEAAVEIHGFDRWWVAPPAHLNYFDNDSLCALLRGAGFEPRSSEATFPLEMFLLFGDDYIRDSDLGRECHRKRVAFETHLRRAGAVDTLRSFYRSLARLRLGRTLVVHARVAQP